MASCAALRSFVVVAMIARAEERKLSEVAPLWPDELVLGLRVLLRLLNLILTLNSGLSGKVVRKRVEPGSLRSHGIGLMGRMAERRRLSLLAIAHVLDLLSERR